MASALDAHFGLALQTAKGTPNVTASAFDYIFFSEGTGITPVSDYLPLDQEIGAGPLTRDVKRVGVHSEGMLSFIPRAKSIGKLLKGVLGAVSTVAPTGPATAYVHTFKFAANAFTLPYYTARRRLGAAAAGDIASDVRIAALVLSFDAANFVRAQMSLLGAGTPQVTNNTSAWTPDTYVDSSEPFLTCKATVELPTGTQLKVLSGSVTIANQMPIDEQRMVGKYNLDDIEVVSRAIQIEFIVKVTDISLYRKLQYGVLAGSPTYPADWLPQMYRDAALTLTFQSESEIDAGVPYALTFKANDSSPSPNLVWACEPIGLRGNKQVLMKFSGTILADTASATDGPFSVHLTNLTASY